MAGYILLTALPPTKGHEYLITFASKFMAQSSAPWDGPLNVILCTQPHEPMIYERVVAVSDLCTKLAARSGSVRFHHFPKKIQQSPNGEDPNFWVMWQSIFVDHLGLRLTEADYLFSSEEYGFKLADVLGIKHIPVDIKRQVVSISGTRVRSQGPFYALNNVMSTYKRFLRKKVTIFGAESTGKTTLAKSLAWGNEEYRFVHEWARPYLESLKSPEVTEERMENIVYGQYAAMTAVEDQDHLLTIRDTDLLSTIGYYRIYNKNYKKLKGYNDALRLFLATKADFYLLTKSNIPFVQDPLRYGGDKRESTDQFWVDLLREFSIPYGIIDGFAPHTRVYQAQKQIEQLFNSRLWGYQRE